MAAILRVKRKNTDVPMDTLVIACKRLKTEITSDTSTVQTVAQFAGTLTDPDVTKHVAKILPKLSVESHKAGVKRSISDDDCPVNISGKVPKWIDVNSVAERYKITDSLDTTSEEDFKDKWMTLIDIEDCWSISHLTNLATEEDIGDYVYDLYYAQTGNDFWLESNNILVQKPEYPDADVEMDFSNDNESSDSNAESHWRNDYPDTDPDRSSDDSSDVGSGFDLFKDTDSVKPEDRYTYIFERRYMMENTSEYESSDDESNSSDDKERSSDEIKLEDEEISDNERMDNI